jgi:hypothetical protein
MSNHTETVYFKRPELVEMTTNLLKGDSAAVMNSDDEEIISLKQYLNRFSNSTLNQIVTVLSAKIDRYYVPLSRLITGESPVSEVHEYLHFSEALKGVFTPRVAMLIKGLHCTPLLPKYEDYSLAPQNVKDQCAALLLATERLYVLNPNGPLVPHNGKEYHIVDESLVELILKRHSEIEFILAAFSDGRMSAESVLGCFDNPASALATGTL